MIQTQLPWSTDPIDPLGEVDEEVLRLADAGRQMVADALRAGGVYVGHPDDDLVPHTLAAVSLGAEPTAAEREESRRWTRRCDGCGSPRHECGCAPVIEDAGMPWSRIDRDGVL